MANARQPENIQDAFLNQLRRERTLVTLCLTSGAKLTGRIKQFDKYAIILESENHEQLVFKHAIATLLRGEPPPEPPTKA